MSEWKKYKLDDLINVKHGYAFKGEFFSDEPTDDILLTPGNFKIGGGFKSDKFKYFAGEYPESYILKEGDILITMTDLSKEGDTLGYAAKVPAHSGIRYLHNQRLGLVEFKNKTVDEDFLYWILRTQQYQYFIVGSATGSTVRHTSPSRIAEYEFLAPESKAEQQKIASILSSLDDKIELNNQMNQTLEQIAQAIFKEWFVDFNFPGFDGNLVDGLPKGWRKGKLEEIIEFINGYAFKSNELLSVDDDSNYHILKMGHIKKGGGFNINGTKNYFPREKSKNLKKFIAQVGDCLMCMTDMKDNVALLGHTALMSEENKYLVNQRVGILRVRNELGISYPFIYLLTNMPFFIEELRTRANKGVQVNLSTSEIKNTEIIIPAEDVSRNFDKVVKPLYEKIFQNDKQSQKLLEIREIILPKLMSNNKILKKN